LNEFINLTIIDVGYKYPTVICGGGGPARLKLILKIHIVTPKHKKPISWSVANISQHYIDIRLYNKSYYKT